MRVGERTGAGAGDLNLEGSVREAIADADEKIVDALGLTRLVELVVRPQDFERGRLDDDGVERGGTDVEANGKALLRQGGVPGEQETDMSVQPLQWESRLSPEVSGKRLR